MPRIINKWPSPSDPAAPSATDVAANAEGLLAEIRRASQRAKARMEQERADIERRVADLPQGVSLAPVREAYAREGEKKLRDQSRAEADALVAQIRQSKRDLTAAKASLPDKRALLLALSAATPEGAAAAQSLAGVPPHLLAGVASWLVAQGDKLDQSRRFGLAAALISRVDAMERSDQPFSPQEFASNVRYPAFDEAVAAIERSEALIKQSENEWLDFSRGEAGRNPNSKILSGLRGFDDVAPEDRGEGPPQPTPTGRIAKGLKAHGGAA